MNYECSLTQLTSAKNCYSKTQKQITEPLLVFHLFFPVAKFLKIGIETPENVSQKYFKNVIWHMPR